jgi:hypothetical protein
VFDWEQTIVHHGSAKDFFAFPQAERNRPLHLYLLINKVRFLRIIFIRFRTVHGLQSKLQALPPLSQNTMRKTVR